MGPHQPFRTTACPTDNSEIEHCVEGCGQANHSDCRIEKPWCQYFETMQSICFFYLCHSCSKQTNNSDRQEVDGFSEHRVPGGYAGGTPTPHEGQFDQTVARGIFRGVINPT